jgi:HK97 family phage portal protein
VKKLGFVFDRLRKNQELEWLFDLEYLEDISQRAYLKRMALDTCIQFVGRSIAQCHFQVRDGNASIKKELFYKLNVRPNSDQSASTFWETVIYKLIHDGECLIVLSDTEDFLIADRFTRDEFALYDDVFHSVVVKNYEFKRSFKMSDVLFLEYGNIKLSRFLDGLFEDYGEMFGRMINAQLRNYQLRGIVKVGAGQTFDDKRQEKLQNFINKLYGVFNKNSVAIVPQMQGMEYEELSTSRLGSTQSIEELTNLKKSVMNDVAKFLGIPPSLIHGEMADLSNSMKAFEKYCKHHFIRKIQDEMNAKLFTPDEFLKGHQIKIISKGSPLESAESTDKLIASGAFTQNEVREMYGYERGDDPQLDRYILTKNYQTKEELEVNGSGGGDGHEKIDN